MTDLACLREGADEASLFDVGAVLRDAIAADLRRTPEERRRAAAALDVAREEARRFLSRLWVRALRGVVVEPHAAQGFTSGFRVAVGQSLAVRLLAYGVPADLVTLLVAGWGQCYVDPPLEENEVLELVRSVRPDSEGIAA